MFDYIRGTIISKKYPYCTIEAHGIGYLVFVNLKTLKKLPNISKEAKIYTELIHKEDSMMLCGFLNIQDRILFQTLLSVSGVGMKVALSLLNELETTELINAILDGDYKTLARTKGIGTKMAQKVVLEVKDKLTKMEFAADIITSKNQDLGVSNSTIMEASAVLESLGYSATECKNALETAVNNLKRDDSQELIKHALKILSIL